MAIIDYSTLQTAIANSLARTDLTNQIPDFITLAEARLSRELETREQEKRALATLTAGDEFTALPTDMRELRQVKLNTSPNTVLEYMSPVALDNTFPSGSNGLPSAFSVVGQEIKLRPVPDSAYVMEIIYIGNLPALSNTNTSNTMLTRHPDAYLTGSLVEAYLYLMDDQRAQLYDQKFSRIIEEVRKDEDRSSYGSGALQIQSVYQRQANI
jgi:hypothetical protein